MGPLVSALSEGARRHAAFRMDTLRKALDGKPVRTAVVDQVRMDAIGGILSVASPRLRDLVEARGTRHANGTASLVLPGEGGNYTLTTSTDAGATGQPHPVLDVKGPGDDTDGSFRAHFLQDEVAGTWCVASGSTGQELAILAVLEGLRPHLPAWDGTFLPDPTGRLRMEHEMVRADGGFPGDTCREHLDTLRNEAVRGLMLSVAKALPELAGMQGQGGYRWGKRYLSYDSTDKSGCLVPATDGVACFHENISLMDDNASWVVGITEGGESAGRVAVWAFDRNAGDPVEAIGHVRGGSLAGLGEPHVSVELATGAVVVRDAFEPGTLVGNVLHGLTREIHVFDGVMSVSGSHLTEDRTDFDSFSPGYAGDEFDGEDDEDEDAPLGPRF